MSVDQSFKAFKKKDLKVDFKLRLDCEKYCSERRAILKIMKIDEYNQYGSAMTKPIPTGCIKEESVSWIKFNLLLEKVDFNDEIGHPFVVDIEFNYQNASPKQIMYNEIFPPITDEQKKLDANERSAFQISKQYSETDNNNLK